jgi:hypothetical protein
MHHTKDEGDLGVAKVHADLVGKNMIVLFPMTEHAPFDLVAYADGHFNRLQVKYRSARGGSNHRQISLDVGRSPWVALQPVGRDRSHSENHAEQERPGGWGSVRLGVSRTTVH